MCVILLLYISGHNISPCHSIHTGLPVIVLSIDVECHTGSHIYPFYCLESDLIVKPLSQPSSYEVNNNM